ncbi:endonuclease domain-containing protein [Blastococcus sp. SYSU DS0539]
MYLRSQGLHGVFVGAHAVSEGALSRAQLMKGPYVRVLHGVYADPSLPRDHMLKTRAAALLMPPEAVLGGRTAAAMLGGPAPNFGDPVTVIVPPGTKWRGPQGVRVHTAELPAGDITVDDGLRRTVGARTAWDVAAREPVATAVGVLDAMVRAGRVTTGTLMGLIRDRGGAWGSRRVRRAFELVDARAESPPESWVRVACALARLPAPVPQYEVVEGGVWLGRVDLAWPAQRLVVEYEGAYHFDGVQVVRDDERYRRLVAAGWRVIRVAAHDLRAMEAVVARIRDALRSQPPN